MYYESEEHWVWEYDSTWEDEYDPKSDLRKPSKRGTSRSARAARDMQNYRRGYPDTEDQDYDEMNLKFYKNEICFEPNGVRIEDILEHWKKEYDQLEENHSYIQWLFPLREMGMNWYAKPLTQQEIEVLKTDEDVKRRFCEAYKLMLDFYGIKLMDEKTGEVARAQNYKERFSNLNRHGHNNLRITRILKCLGELGYESFQFHLVRFFLEETLVKKELPNVRRSALDYFMFTLRNREQRKELVLFAWEQLKDKGKFIWGPSWYLKNRELSTDSCIKRGKVQLDNNEKNICVGMDEGNSGVDVSKKKPEAQQSSIEPGHTEEKKEKSTDESFSDKNTQKELPHNPETNEYNSGTGSIAKDKSEPQQAVDGAEHNMEQKEKDKIKETSENVKQEQSEQEGTGDSSLDKNPQKELPHTLENEGVDKPMLEEAGDLGGREEGQVEAEGKNSNRGALTKVVEEANLKVDKSVCGDDTVAKVEDPMKRKDFPSTEERDTYKSGDSVSKKIKLNDMHDSLQRNMSNCCISPDGVSKNCSISEQRPRKESTVNNMDGIQASNEIIVEEQARQPEGSMEQIGNGLSQGAGGGNLNKDGASGTETNENVSVPDDNIDTLESE
ncbi:opioid growth factor receptor-like protein 1 [Xenopus laevis]|nr:opioid growth factor receptor-like protein 1 [Xenopus laevis]